MGTSTFHVQRDIAATPEAVFDAGVNVPTWADVIPAIDKIEMLTSGPIAVGTRFRETRTVMGREATEEMEFAELTRPSRYVIVAESHGCRYRTVHTVEPIDGGSRLTMEFNTTPVTFGGKVMSLFMKPFMKKMADMCGKDLDALGAHVEASAH